jgi:hypothetical protein
MPPGFDSGTFSQSMMEGIKHLWIKLKPKASKGGRIRMDAFELREAALSARGPAAAARVARFRSIPGRMPQL